MGKKHIKLFPNSRNFVFTLRVRGNFKPIRVINSPPLPLPYSHFRKQMRTAAVYVHVTSTSKGNKRAQLNFINFLPSGPATEKPTCRFGQKGLETRVETRDFCSRAWLTRKTGRFVKRRSGGYEEYRGWTGSDNRTRLPFLATQKRKAAARIQAELSCRFSARLHKDEIFMGGDRRTTLYIRNVASFNDSVPVFSFLSLSLCWKMSEISCGRGIIHFSSGKRR